MIATHKIRDIKFENDFMILHIDGKELKVAYRDVSLKLSVANDLQRNFYKITFDIKI